MRLITTLAVIALFALSACSQSDKPLPAGRHPHEAKFDLTPAKDSCKNFPVVIYPNTTSKTCEKNTPYENTPVSYTAYVESKDSVSKVTKFYKTQVQKLGWKVDPVKAESATHAVVTIRKGIAYATVTINTGDHKKGSSFQIHAFPFGQ